MMACLGPVILSSLATAVTLYPLTKDNATPKKMETSYKPKGPDVENGIRARVVNMHSWASSDKVKKWAFRASKRESIWFYEDPRDAQQRVEGMIQKGKSWELPEQDEDDVLDEYYGGYDPNRRSEEISREFNSKDSSDSSDNLDKKFRYRDKWNYMVIYESFKKGHQKTPPKPQRPKGSFFRGIADDIRNVFK